MTSAEALAATALDSIRSWAPLSPAQAALREEYVAFVEEGQGDVIFRGGAEHLTGSCFVLTPDLLHVLLCFHRKGQFWVQVGGHVEPGDGSLAAGAFREAREESGIETLEPFEPDGAPVDLHRHALSSRFGTCLVHWDVGYVAFVDLEALPVVSDESEAVAWFRVDRLPPDTPEDFPVRLRTVLEEMTHRRRASA
ncbi:NUDIX hydrolase [Oerskovia enterophila]|uniref:NUDIX domain protein n=1 Tax=Oerskovia enterophila TaxID=43678 RepID=A0A163QWH1_9CELL|nr:NUDIX domain-containing protein [Oerskovia enterophila]KZM34611.1 NUDIX domain protein [Oerskovia enterophila]